MPTHWSEELHIRPLAIADLDDVLHLEQQEPSPWSLRQVAEELDGGKSVALVAVGREVLFGWCCGRWCGSDGEVLKISVARHCRRHGIGTRLLAELFDRFVVGGVTQVFLEVRAGRDDAVLFYGGLGFVEIGRRRNYYRHPDEDALVMRRSIGQGG